MYESLRQKLRIPSVFLNALLCLAVLFLFLFVTAQPASAAEIDLTSLANMVSDSHSHNYVEKFDDTHHWEECVLCKITRNKESHSLSISDTYSATCHSNNYRVSLCGNCAYNERYRYTSGEHDLYIKELGWDSNRDAAYIIECCRKCLEHIGGSYVSTVYHYEDGTLVNPSCVDLSKKIVAPNGNILKPNCHVYIEYSATTDVAFTLSDDKQTLTMEGKIYFSDEFREEAKHYENLYGTRSLERIYNLYYMTASNPNGYDYNITNISSEHLDKGWVPVSSTIQLSDMTRDSTSRPYLNLGLRKRFADGSVIYDVCASTKNIDLSYLLLYHEPSITTLDVSNVGQVVNGYSNELTLNIQGTIVGSADGYITVTEDATGNILCSRRRFSISGDDTYKLSLNMNGISTDGGTVTVKVEDYFGKTVTSQITIPAVDTNAPSIQNLSSIDLRSVWEQKKTVTFQILENGVGGVQVAVNKEDTYTSATDKGNGIWEIEYTFTGDVYDEKNICVYLKDALGNIQTTLIPVNKFDVTPPRINTVSFAELSNTQPFFSVNATDDGCGGLQYRIKNSAGETSVWSSSGIVGLSESGTYVIEVKDALGNVAASDEQTVELNSYTVTFCDYDGTVISSETYQYGDTPVIPADPERAEDGTATYTFLDWTYAISNVAENVTYTARYLATYKNYTVVFKDWDNTIITSKSDYRWNDQVVVPADPYRAEDGKGTYTFTGWSPDVVERVAGNATYIATYSTVAKTYTVIFEDWDGTVISINTYNYGDRVVIPDSPERAEDDTYTYQFIGWNYEVSAQATEDITYTARYSKTKRNYTVMYKNWNGELLYLYAGYGYGDTVYQPTIIPTPPSDDERLYVNVFSHWSTQADGTNDFSPTVTGNAVYTAQFVRDYIDYTITFRNSDGTILTQDTYHWGDTVVVPPDPTRGDSTYTYTFTGWNTPIVPVNGNATYVAMHDTEYIDYTIGFKDWDGSTLSLKTDYHYGDSITQPDTPQRDPLRDANDVIITTYSFTGWNRVDRVESSVTGTVTGNAIYVAQYAENPESHTVKFVDYNGTEISSAEYDYGAPIAIPSDPYRTADDTYTYEFSGWSPTVSSTCIGGAVYVATYTPSYRDYTVKFLDYDGTEFSVFTRTYHMGDFIENMVVPSRSPVGETIYTFTGWEPEFNAVCTGDATYTAVYSENTATYTVKFLDWDGTPILIRTDYKKGDSISIPSNPIRPQENGSIYTFTGWSPDVSTTCNGNATYIAQYSVNAATFTVTFKDWDGTVVQDKSDYYYLDPVVEPEITLIRDQDNSYTYEFSGWAPEITPVTGNAVYVAQYTPTYREYTVSFQDYDGTIISSEVYHWGDTIVIPHSPSRPKDDHNSYSFAGWSPTVSLSCNGNAVYTAEYTAIPLSNNAVNISGGGTVTINPERPSAGDKVTITVTPNSGFIVGDIIITDKDGNRIPTTDHGDGNFSYTQPDGSVDITVNFEKKPSESGNTGGSSSGSSGASPEQTAPANKVQPTVNGTIEVSPPNPSVGDNITVIVTPNPGYILGDITIIDKNGNKIPVVDLGDNHFSFIQPNGSVTISVSFISLSDVVASCAKDDTCPLVRYTDIAPNAWYHDGVHYCLEAGLLVGTSSTTFSPYEDTSRGQLATILWSMAGRPIVEPIIEFSDVSASNYYFDAIHWLTASGIASGNGDGTFGAEDPITREQMIAILWNYAQQPEAAKTILPHTDAHRIEAYAVPAMQWAYSNGLIYGDDSGNLLPSNTALRAEVAVILRSFHILQTN